jgi:hypothetical protein
MLLFWLPQAKINLNAARNVSASSEAGVYGCMWAGITRLKVGLAPGEVKSLDLTAVFTQVRRREHTHARTHELVAFPCCSSFLLPISWLACLFWRCHDCCVWCVLVCVFACA